MKASQILGIVLLLLLISAALVACGNEEQTGVALQPVGQRSTATPAPSATPVPTEMGTSTPAFELSGRLLVLWGGQFAIYDLASEEIVPLDGPRASSPAALSDDATRGAFVAFPNFAVFDLTTGTVRTLDNPGSIPTSLSLSPDGDWLATVTGTITVRLLLIAVGDGTVYSVASSSQRPLAWAWTTDGRLAWWWSDADPPQVQVFDPTARTSIPLSEAGTAIMAPLAAALSPDGTRAALVPIAGGPAQPQECFDSYVALFDVPLTAGVMPAGETLWTEAGLVASSPQWLDRDTVLFVKLGVGTCGQVAAGATVRQIMALDVSGGAPRALAGPLGNADDPNDRAQQFARQVSQLYSPSPDGAYLAWIGGGVEEGQTLLNITEVASGQTTVALRFTRADAQDMADFIENWLLRQVVWLP